MRALVVWSLVVVALAAPDPAGASAPTCLGETATVVGRPGDVVVGTAGPDVIVSNGASAVRSGAGSDRVCITRGHGRTEVRAGRGDDRIRVLGRRDRVHAFLGTGDDEFVGGPGPDWVHEGVPQGDRNGRDVIRTGAGPDRVGVDGQRQPAFDAVDLGAGADRLAVTGRAAPSAVPVGGPGVDEISFNFSSESALVDNRSGTVTLPTGVRWRWEGFDLFTSSFHLGGVEFRGGPEDERIRFDDLANADMGGGDDLVEWGSEARWIEGGAGTDRIVMAVVDGFELDLARGTLLTSADSSPRPLTGFEDVDAYSWSGPAEITGTEGPNRLRLNSCRSVVSAGAGADVVVQPDDAPPSYDCSTPRAEVDGGAGADVISFGSGTSDDLLVGGEGDDRLVGGAGVDEADGGPGTDLCSAEAESLCEE